MALFRASVRRRARSARCRRRRWAKRPVMSASWPTKTASAIRTNSLCSDQRTDAPLPATCAAKTCCCKFPHAIPWWKGRSIGP